MLPLKRGGRDLHKVLTAPPPIADIRHADALVEYFAKSFNNTQGIGNGTTR